MGARFPVTVRFYAELNEFLAAPHRGKEVELVVDRTSVKDLIERLGVPHTQVDLVIADGEPVGFGHIVRAGERIAAYPRFMRLDVAGVTKVRPAPLSELRFVADEHLGKLARYLRLLGFDTVYRNSWDDAELAALSAREGRVLLTRDRGLLKRRVLVYAYCVAEDEPHLQLAEVARRFELSVKAHPFSRCVACNGRLALVPKEDVLDQLEPLTREHYDEFHRCQGCGHVYWRGSHHERLAPLFESVLAPSRHGA